METNYDHQKFTIQSRLLYCSKINPYLYDLFENEDRLYDLLKGGALRVNGHNVAGVLARSRLRRRNAQSLDEKEIWRIIRFRLLQHRKQVGEQLRVPAPDL